MPSFLRAAGTSSTSCRITLKPFFCRCSAHNLQQPHCALLYTSTTGKACSEPTRAACPEPCARGCARPEEEKPNAAHSTAPCSRAYFIGRALTDIPEKLMLFVFMIQILEW